MPMQPGLIAASNLGKTVRLLITLLREEMDWMKKNRLLTLCIVSLLLTGCLPEVRKVATGQGESSQPTTGQDEYLPIRFLEHARPANAQGDHPHFLPIFQGKKLHLILGTVQLNEFTSTLAAYDLRGNEVWRIDSTYGARNPRPYQGRHAGNNERELHLLGGAIIADHDGDSVEDIYATAPKSSIKNHVAIISGASGKVIVQSEVNEKRRFDFPTAVCNLNGDSVNDFYFVSASGNRLESLSLSGSDLSSIATDSVEFPGRRVRLMIDKIPDETGDKVCELLVRCDLKDNQTWAVVNGMTLQAIRELPKMRSTEYQFRGFFLPVGDVDGKGETDFIACSRSGSNENHRDGYIKCFRGEDGSTLWSRSANSFGGHQQVVVDERDAPGQPTENQQNTNLLGQSGIVVPDQNGDGILELALCLSMDDQMPQRQRTIVIVSGKDGRTIGKHEFDGLDPGMILSLIGKTNLRDEPLKIGIKEMKDKKSRLMLIHF